MWFNLTAKFFIVLSFFCLSSAQLQDYKLKGYSYNCNYGCCLPENPQCLNGYCNIDGHCICNLYFSGSICKDRISDDYDINESGLDTQEFVTVVLVLLLLTPFTFICACCSCWFVFDQKECLRFKSYLFKGAVFKYIGFYKKKSKEKVRKNGEQDFTQVPIQNDNDATFQSPKKESIKEKPIELEVITPKKSPQKRSPPRNSFHPLNIQELAPVVAEKSGLSQQYIIDVLQNTQNIVQNPFGEQNLECWDFSDDKNIRIVKYPVFQEKSCSFQVSQHQRMIQEVILDEEKKQVVNPLIIAGAFFFGTAQINLIIQIYSDVQELPIILKESNPLFRSNTFKPVLITSNQPISQVSKIIIAIEVICQTPVYISECFLRIVNVQETYSRHSVTGQQLINVPFFVNIQDEMSENEQSEIMSEGK